MSKIPLITLLGLFVLSSSSNNSFRRQEPDNALYEGQYTFEGVDYDLMPESARLEHTDCYGHHHRCIRRKTYFTRVCAFTKRNGYYEDYYSLCEVDLFNCKNRVRNNLGIFGNANVPDAIFYNGEEVSCGYYYRRSRNSLEMDMLYTGSKNPPYRSLPKPDYMYIGGNDEKNLTLSKELYIRDFENRFRGANNTRG